MLHVAAPIVLDRGHGQHAGPALSAIAPQPNALQRSAGRLRISVDRGPDGQTGGDGNVGANLDIMEADTKRMRGDRPYVFTNLKNDTGLGRVAAFIVAAGGLRDAGPQPSSAE